jgi:hypothetical protein
MTRTNNEFHFLKVELGIDSHARKWQRLRDQNMDQNICGYGLGWP